MSKQEERVKELEEGTDPIHLGVIPTDIDPARRWDIGLSVNGCDEIHFPRVPITKPERIIKEDPDAIRLVLYDGAERKVIAQRKSRRKPFRSELFVFDGDGRVEEVTTIDRFRAWNTTFGELRYGLHKLNYATWAWHENGGGGAIAIPYVWCNGELYIGVVEQDRFFQDQQNCIQNVPRGFLKDELDHFETAKQEFAEEMMVSIGMLSGTSDELRARIFPLVGAPGNQNSAFMIQDSSKNEGMRYYGVEMLNVPMMNRYFSCHPSKVRFKLLEGMVIQYDESKSGMIEQIKGADFIHVSLISGLGDAFTGMGVFRLQSYLLKNRASELLQQNLIDQMLLDPKFRQKMQNRLLELEKGAQ